MITSRVSKIQWSFFLVVTLSTMSLRGQSVEDLFTRAETTDFAETTSYEEVMGLSKSLAELSDNIHLTTFGYTNEGRALPLLVVGAPDASAEAVLGTGKTRVYVQGNIHGGEV